MSCPNPECGTDLNPSVSHAQTSKSRRVRRIVTASLILAILSFPPFLITFAYLNKGRPSQDNAVCQQNLRVMQTLFREFRDNNNGRLPSLSSQPGVLMFAPEGIPLNQNADPDPLTCPTIRYAKKQTKSSDATTDPAPLYDDQSYYYLGYALFNDDDVEAFAQAYRDQIAQGGTFDQDLIVEDDNGTRTFRKLSDETFMTLPKAQDYQFPPKLEGYTPVAYQTIGLAPKGDVPILIERNLGHSQPDWGPPRPRGAYVLYAYSGVHFIEEGTWPITEKTQNILAQLAQ